MLLRWIGKNLLQEPAALAASIGGIAFSLVVVLLVEAMFAGESERIVAYLEHAGADVWVMQSGVSNMHMASSLVGGRAVRAVEVVPGVVSATPILNVSAFLESGDDRWYSYIIGVRPEDRNGGPWAMARGRPLPRPGETVIPDVLARKARLGIGSTIKALGETFTIVGISTGTYSMANSLTFVAYADLAKLLSVHDDTASYVLVQATPGTSARELAARIRSAVPEVNAMIRNDAVESDRRMAMQMGVDVIGVMRWVGGSVAALIVALTAYTGTVRRTRELGVVKALGFPNRALYLFAVVQSGVIAGFGYFAAVGVAYAARPVIRALAPEVALLYAPTSLLRLAVMTIVIALTASLVPGRRIAHVDPAVAFRE
jgi:putative ABC transport system permease protein